MLQRSLSHFWEVDVIEWFLVHLALLGLWLDLTWDALPWFVQAVCFLAAMLIVLGILGTLMNALSTWVENRLPPAQEEPVVLAPVPELTEQPTPPQAAQAEQDLAVILDGALLDAHIYARYCWKREREEA